MRQTQPHPSPDRPSRRVRRLWQLIVLLSMLLPALTGSLWFGARYAVQERLAREAQERGWTLRWRTMDLRPEGRLRLDGVEATGPADARVNAGRVEVSWSWRELLDGELAPTRLEVQGLDADLDLGAITHRRDTGPSPGAATASVSTRRTTVALADSRVHLRGLPAGAPDVTLESLQAHGRPDGTSWMTTFDAACVEGCGDAQGLAGEVRLDDVRIEGRLHLSTPMTVHAPVPGRPDPVALSLRDLTVTIPRHGDEVRVGIGQVNLPARQGDWQATVAAQRAEVRLSRSTKAIKGVALVGPTIEVARQAEAPVDAEASTTTAASAVNLPSPARISRTLEGTLPLLQQVSIEQGEVLLRDLGLTLGAVQTAHERGVHRIEAEMLGGRVVAQLDGAGDAVVLELERVSIAPALAVFAPSLVEHVGGRVSGRLEVGWWASDDGDGYTARGELEVEDGRLWHAGLSEDPIEDQHAWLKVDVAYRFAHDEEPDRLVVRELSVGLPSRRGGEPMWLHGRGEARRLAGARRVALAIQLHVDPIDCDRAVAAIPTAMLPHLADQLHLAGSFAPRASLEVDLEEPKGLDLDLDGLPGTCVVTDLGDAAPSFLNDRFTFEVKEGVSRDGIFVGPGSGSYTPLSEIPEYVQAAMYLTEEIGFYKNEGFGKGLIRRALILNLDKGRYVYGGSTISQQLVKNLFLTRTKTLSRKLEEALIVWKMEEEVDKERILELYLNCIEFGPDIYGIKRAARYYFDKEPAELTAMEGAYIAGLKPAPWNGGAFREAGHTPAKGWWLKRHSRIMKRLYVFGHITEEQYRAAWPFIVYFPDYAGSPIELNDRMQLEKWGVEFPDDVIALGRADWAPVPTATVEAPIDEVREHPPTPQPTPAPDPPSPANEGPWMRLDDLPAAP